MFGMEGQQKKKSNEFVFELEKELKSIKLHKNLKEKIEKRVQSIKEILRSGESQEDFDSFGVLLHGYSALLKMMSRFSPK